MQACTSFPTDACCPPPCRPTTARPLLAEVRTWLQQQQQQYRHQEQAAREQEEELMEQMLQAAAAGSLGQPDGQQGPQYASADRPAGAPGSQPPGQQQQGWQVRRPLHEPRPPVLAPAAGAKRRQVSVRPPSRWDYRPAWNEGLRVDDLPLSSRARQAGMAAEPSQALQPKPQAPATGSAQALAGWAAAHAPVLQQPTLTAQAVAHPPAAQHGALYLGPMQASPQPQVAVVQPAQGPPPPMFPPYPAASTTSTCNPVVQQPQQQWYSGSPAAMPAVPCLPPQWQQQGQGQYGWPPAPDPASRPVTAGVQLWQPMPSLQPAAVYAQPQQQAWGEMSQWAGCGLPATHSMAPQPPVQPPCQPPTAMPTQQQRRPATPGAGLGLGCLPCDVSGGANAWQAAAANGANTLRPRSAAAKVGLRSTRHMLRCCNQCRLACLHNHTLRRPTVSLPC